MSNTVSPQIDPASSLLDEIAPPLPSLDEDVETLRSTLSWLQSALSAADSTDERLHLSNSICQVSAGLTRLLRTQSYLGAHSPSLWDQIVPRVLNNMLRKRGRTE